MSRIEEKLITYKGYVEFSIDVNNLDHEFMDAHNIESIDEMGSGADGYIYKLNTNGYKQYKTDGEFIDVIKQCIIKECTSWLNDLGIGIELGLSTVVEDGVEAWTK